MRPDAYRTYAPVGLTILPARSHDMDLPRSRVIIASLRNDVIECAYCADAQAYEVDLKSCLETGDD